MVPRMCLLISLLMCVVFPVALCVFRAVFHVFVFLFLHDFGVSVFLKHESMSSFKGSSFDVFSGLWEQVAEFTKNVFRDTHEDDVWQLLSLILALVVWSVGQSFEN